MEKRKVINMGAGEYQLLKLGHNYGEKRSMKSLVYAIDNEVFDFEISEDIKNEIKNYRKQISKRTERYFQKNRLENNLKN